MKNQTSIGQKECNYFFDRLLLIRVLVLRPFSSDCPEHTAEFGIHLRPPPIPAAIDTLKGIFPNQQAIASYLQELVLLLLFCC